jgi:hypothetical protein
VLLLAAPLVGAFMRTAPSARRLITWGRLASAWAPVNSSATGLLDDFATGVVMIRLSMFTVMLKTSLMI